MIKILEKQHLQTEIIDEFRNLLSTCLRQNVCIFKQKTYKFPDGLPILSLLVADIFMDELEKSILWSSSHAHHVRYWARYVDDILCVWYGSESSLQLFLQELNAYDPEIQFTLEIGGAHLDFFYLSIKLAENLNVLQPKFSVYRKILVTCCIICFSYIPYIMARTHEEQIVFIMFHVSPEYNVIRSQDSWTFQVLKTGMEG